MRSVSVTERNQTPTDVFKKSSYLSTSIPLSQDKINRLLAGEEPAASTQLSQQAMEQSQKEVLQARNSIIELNQNKTNAVVNDIDTYFSGMLSHSSLSSLDMGGLISEALQTPGGQGNSTTMSMDLSLTQAKLNYLVQKFTPAEQQAAGFSEINNYIAQKASAQDAVLKDLTSASLAIAKQTGDKEGETGFSQQLDLLNAGQHASQNERRDMLSLTRSTSDSAAWFSGLRQMSRTSDDADFFKDITSSHVAALQQQWNTFMQSVAAIAA